MAGIKDVAEKPYLYEGALEFSKEELENMTQESLKEKIIKIMVEKYEEKEKEIGSELMRGTGKGNSIKGC